MKPQRHPMGARTSRKSLSAKRALVPTAAGRGRPLHHQRQQRERPNSKVSSRNTSANAITTPCRCTIELSCFKRHRLRVAAVRRELLRQVVERLQRRLPRPGDGLVQARQMQVRAVVEDGGQAASPTAPPRLRVRLKRPEAFFSRSGGSVPSAMLLIGTMPASGRRRGTPAARTAPRSPSPWSGR